QGGMGAIYKAQNRYTGTPCAIKILLPKFAQDNEARQRFIVEATAASGLKHQGICQVHDFGITPSKMPYLVMDWIDGTSLQELVFRDGCLSQNQAIPIFTQVLSALSHAHGKRVIHRDLKPDHILISNDPITGARFIQIVDFGIAKVLEEEYDEAKGLTRSGT